MLYILLLLQHLFSVLFTNKHALMRYLNRYERIKYKYININNYVDKIQQLGIYNLVKGSLKFNYNHQFHFYNQKNCKLHLCFMKKNV